MGLCCYNMRIRLLTAQKVTVTIAFRESFDIIVKHGRFIFYYLFCLLKTT